MDDLNYIKRQGTSGIYGQLYETKLISLLLYRLTKDEEIEQFHLASNMADIGDFDDICVSIKLKDGRNIMLFVQAKHKESDNGHLIINDNVLLKWATSTKKIQEASYSKHDTFFCGEENDYYLLVYTNAEYNFRKSVSNVSFKGDIANDLNRWLSTNDKLGSLARYTSKDVEFFSARLLEHELEILAERLAKYLCNDQTEIMNDYFMLKYHVILAKEVVELSAIQSTSKLNFRYLMFRSDFFTTSDKKLALFRNYLFTAILKYKTSSTSEIRLIKPSALWSKHAKLTLTLILMSINYEKEKYVFKKNKYLPLSNNEAKIIAALSILIPLKVKVPVTFGNIDLHIQDKHKITILANYLNNLCENSKHFDQNAAEIVTERIDPNMLKLGLGSAIGNVFDYDEITKHLKFTSDRTKLQDNAKILLSTLKTKVKENLNKYRFPVETTQLPKLSFDCRDTAKEFLDKLVIFSKQGNQAMIEDIIQKCIETTRTNPQGTTATSETIFQKYHGLVQTWWMSKNGQYLTKSTNLYQQAITDLESQMTALQNIYYTSKTKYFQLKFDEKATQVLKTFIESIGIFSKMIITTETTTMTTNKLIDCLTIETAVIDFDLYCNLKSSPERFSALKVELSKTDKLIILVCNISSKNSNSNIIFKELTKAIENKKVIFVIDNTFLDKFKEKLPKINQIYHDETSLVDLKRYYQGSVINKAKIYLHGKKIRLEYFIDNELLPTESIKGEVFEELINTKVLILGKDLGDAKYDKIKDLYIPRRIYQDLKRYDIIELFHNQNVALITAKPGMGKSTLLTHFSVQQTNIQANVINSYYKRYHHFAHSLSNHIKVRKSPFLSYIVRVNLLDYSRIFWKWHENKTDLNFSEILGFICQVVINNYEKELDVRVTKNKVHLNSSVGNARIDFELNVFLNLYNKGNVLFLFDGFDEICPYYKNYVVNFLKILKDNLGLNRMWLTSRYNKDFLEDLVNIFGKPFKIEHVAFYEQEVYLNKFWHNNINVKSLTDVQVGNVNHILDSWPDNNGSKCFNIFNNFVAYLMKKFPQYVNRYNVVREGPRPSGGIINNVMNIDGDCGNQSSNYENNVLETNNYDEKLTGTPLILYLTANYCVSLINDAKNTNIVLSNFTDFEIYEMFIETKLKNILFEDKNKMDLTNPFLLKQYEKDRKLIVDIHKKMAAFAIFGETIGSRQEINFKEFEGLKTKDDKDLIEFESMIACIKNGEEKTGLITHVTIDNIPVFIHRTFAEYFAAEFLWDIFDSTIELEIKRLLYTTVIETPSYGVKKLIVKKIGMNKNLEQMTKEFIPHVYKTQLRKVLPKDLFIRLLSATPEDFESEFYNEETTNSFVNNVLFSKENEEEIDKHIRKTIYGIVNTMKPHLKQHFEVYLRNIDS